jgi:hypothetical protein
MLTPPLHHGPAPFYVVCAVVGASDLILVDMRQGYLNEFGIKAIFIENGAGD